MPLTPTVPIALDANALGLDGRANKPVLEAIFSASDHLDSWIESQEFKGWDPHDALNSPLIGWLTQRSRYAGIFWLQLLKRSPLNLRRLLRIRKGYNPKGMGLFLASYTRKYLKSRDPKHL